MNTQGKILIVEDDTLIAHSLQQTLALREYETRVATSGADAQEAFTRFEPDLVLLDINLSGGIDGILVGEYIRARSDIPLIYLTAYSDAKLIERSKQTTPHGYLLKPFQRDDVLAAIVIARHKHHQERLIDEARKQLQAEVERRTRTEDALRKLSAAVEQSPAMTVITDTQGIIEYVRSQVCQHNGLSGLRRAWQDPPHPEFRASAAVVLPTVMADLARRERMARRVSESQKRRQPVLGICLDFADQNADGQVTHFLKVAEDMTARKQAEEAMAWQARADAAMAQLSQAIIALTSLEEISAIVLDHARALTGSAFGFVGYIDPATGALISPTLTRDIWEDCHVTVSDKSVVFHEFHGLWGWVLTHRQPVLTNDPAHDPRSTGVPNGHVPISRFLSAPALAADTLVGQIALANSPQPYTDQDVTLVQRLAELYAIAVQDKQSREQLREAKDAAEAANLAKSQFLASMSHELRTPLNGILGYARLLQQQLQGPEAHRRGLEMITQNADHLLVLLNDILDMAKIETGKIEIEPIPFSLGNALEHLANAHAPRCAEKGVTFHYLPAPDLPHFVTGDMKRLRQILLNLLGNAIKFTTRGAITFRVTRLASPPAMIRFEIQDTGIGIPPEQIATMFPPFVSLEVNRLRPGGPGLGLPLCQRLLRMMDSELRIISAPGTGSVFWFDLALPDVTDTRQQHEAAAFALAESEHAENEAQEQTVVPLPAAILAPLYDLSLLGDILEIRHRLETVDIPDPIYAPFAQKLRALAKELRLVELQDILRQSLAQGGDGHQNF